jgi:hypothetical protein
MVVSAAGQQVVGPVLLYNGIGVNQLLAAIKVLCGCKGAVRCRFCCFYRFFVCPAI